MNRSARRAPASGISGFGVSDPQHRLDVGGVICIRRPAGPIHITNDGADTNLAADPSVDIQNFSGLLLVSNTTTGSTGSYLCGGSNAALINSVTGVAGALSFASGPSRYLFTNTSGSIANFRLLLLRLRDVA